MSIITKEMLFQYRVHGVLNKLKSDWELDEVDFKKYLETKDGMSDFGQAMLDDIDIWCGVSEALLNDN